MNLLMCPELRAVGGESGRKEANRRLSRTAAGTRSLPHTLRTARRGGRGTAASPPLRPGCPRGAVGCPSHAPRAHGAASELANPGTAGRPGLPTGVRGTLPCAPMGARPPPPFPAVPGAAGSYRTLPGAGLLPSARRGHAAGAKAGDAPHAVPALLPPSVQDHLRPPPSRGAGQHPPAPRHHLGAREPGAPGCSPRRRAHFHLLCSAPGSCHMFRIRRSGLRHSWVASQG